MQRLGEKGKRLVGEGKNENAVVLKLDSIMNSMESLEIYLPLSTLVSRFSNVFSPFLKLLEIHAQYCFLDS